jgi:hypothetical protein
MAATAERLRESGLGPMATGEFALKAAIRVWFTVAVAGQLFFVAHIVSFYGRSALAGDFAHWNKVLARGFVPGDHIGNAALVVHLAMAALITFGGPLQLIPQIRTHFPAFHRWTGRAYLVVAVLASTSALYLSLVRRGVPGGFLQHATVDLNAVLILIFAALALRYALARQFAVHRRWAIRLFLAVSGVWFFRVGLFFWILINHGPVGFNPDTFEGPAIIVVGFAQYLLPLTVFEIYWRTQQRAGAAGRIAMAATLAVLTVAMGMGIFAHVMFAIASGSAF